MNFNTDLFNPTQLGMIRAMELRLKDAAKKRAPKYPRYTVSREPYLAIHANRCLTALERDLLNAKIEAVNAAETAEDKIAAMAEISSKVAKPVKIMRLNFIDHSKTYRGPGAKERARAASRLARAEPIELAA